LALADVWHPTGSVSLAYAQDISRRKREVVPIPYAVDAVAFRSDEGVRHSDRLKVLVVSKLNDREGVADVLSAVGRLPFVDLTVVGDGVLRSEFERASSAWKARVRFEGYVPYPSLPAHYRNADVFVHAAHWEPWGVSIQEALLSRTAVIASRRVESTRDLMPGELSHWLFDAGDVDAIASLLSELQSPSVRELQLKSALPLALALSSQTTATRIAKWFGTNIP
jgi:glycosyltransferase involved in cell wall biosynthesis